MSGKIGWAFNSDNGDFQIDNPHLNSYLYFPLANEAGMMSSITPTLNGDIKTGQNTFFMEPVSSEDLHNSRSSRNFWLYIEGYGAWSCTGISARQTAAQFTAQSDETVRLNAGFLWHRLSRENKKLGISAEITSFCPMTGDRVELTQITIKNSGSKPVQITPTAVFPVYGRSADNVRDHRNVTSLLHRIRTAEYGIEVKPTFSFDERGHKINKMIYAVAGADGNGNPPEGFFPIVEDFIGEGGSYDWPEAVAANKKPQSRAGEEIDGYEAVGGLRFKDVTLSPGGSVSYIIAASISEESRVSEEIAKKYCSSAAFDKYLAESKSAWQEELSTIGWKSGDSRFDMWMKWVSIQPILRRIFGCSFLPHHDYGRGGRGWRDLWQDCLALLIMEPNDVKNQLLNNYGGVRIDGSNATIIGSKPGEFIADRNNIARSWMDHGSWPFLTTLLYINQSGDLDFLLKPQVYFKDKLVRRSKAVDEKWTPEYGSKLKQSDGKLYEGSILEHIIIQNAVQFYNVGKHNNIRLEDADWNDALDMAYENGESVAFSSFYSSNLQQIAGLLKALQSKKGLEEIEILEEMGMLLGLDSGKVNYDSVDEKVKLLNRYFDACIHNVSGHKVKVSIDMLVKDLEDKAGWIVSHIRKNEWIKNKDGHEWFNGYYDNSGKRVEGDFPGGVRMTLTGQVFPIMGNVASPDQIKKVTQAVNEYLKDPKIGGYRLNTNFHEVKLDLGRAFGFAFGTKENGAMFSHMAVMYANALYKRGFVAEGYDVLDSIYQLSSDFEKARIYPGIPEYFNERRRGMYHYLTGSASWLLLTVLAEVYGVKGKLGDLSFEPKLLNKQFNEEKMTSVHTLFAERSLDITYHNPRNLEFGGYTVQSIRIDNKEAEFSKEGSIAILDRGLISGLDKNQNHQVEVLLG
jgi:cellobiose phosphorylase